MAYSCWAKPHEPEAVVVGKIAEIKLNETQSDSVIYTLETYTWFKGIPQKTITLEVSNSPDDINTGDCFIPFVGKLGETWVFQGFSPNGDSYVFDGSRGIMLSNSEGEVIKKIPRPLIEFYQQENRAKGDIYQSKLEYELERFWRSLNEAIRSRI